MKKPWLPLVVVVSVCLMGGVVVLVRHVSTLRKEAEARRAAEQLERQREVERGEVVAAFTDPVAPSPEEAADFARVLGRFSDAMKAEDGPAVAALFDGERLFDEMLVQGGPGLSKKVGPRGRASFVAGFRTGASNMIANPLLRWDTTVVRRIRWSADRAEAVVIATHRNTFQIAGEDVPLALKMRWWFVRRGGEWKVYDLESLDDGLRISVTTAELLRDANPARVAALRDGMAAMKEALSALMSGDLDALDDALARCRQSPFPGKLQATFLAMEAGGQMARGNARAALDCIERAEKLNPDMPLRHSVRMECLNRLGDHEGALAASDAYFEQLGGDEDFYVQRGVALEGLGRLPEAATSYRKALDEFADTKDAFDGLRRVLPKDQKAELGERLAKARDPGKLFGELTPLALQDRDDAAVEVYEATLRKLRPDDPRGITAHIRRLVTARKFADAAAEMKAGLARAPADRRAEVLNGYLFAMLGADRAAEAYAAAPEADSAAAFRLLADDLDETASDEPGEEKYARQLRELVAAHAKRVPDDPWTTFYEGTLLQGEKKYAEAERKFAQAQAAYQKSPPPKKGDGDRDWEADRFRSRRVACLHALKQGPKAYAEIGPAGDTFLQLAHLYEQEKNWDALGAMIAAHRKEHPEDRNGAYWAANLLYLRGKYPDAAAAFQKYLADATEADANRWLAADRCARAYLRAGKPRDARRAVEEFGGQRTGPALRVAVALADGKPAEAEAILAELVGKGQKADYLYYDEDFARAIAAPQFAELREKYPDPRPVPKGTGGVG